MRWTFIESCFNKNVFMSKRFFLNNDFSIAVTRQIPTKFKNLNAEVKYSGYSAFDARLPLKSFSVLKIDI